MKGLIIGVVLGLLIAGTAADAATHKKFLTVCVQMSGPPASVGDINVRLKKACQPHQKPIKLATYPAPPGPQGPPGEPGFTTTTIVKNTTPATTASGKTITARCPTNMNLTGGGFSTSVLSTDLTLRQSSPQGTSSWFADVHEVTGFPGSISWSLTVYALCAN